MYNIQNWGAGYFGINDAGNVEVIQNNARVELQDIIKAAAKAGLQLPLLIRFPAILHDRIRLLYAAFAYARTEIGYTGSYRLVYPIKVNQQQYVVREIFNAPEQVGLEAGSKPELVAAIGSLAARPTTLVCNGYKDSGYIRLALIAQQMGHKVFIVVEKPDEIDIVVREARALGVKPCLGIRIKLNTQGEGMWQDSGGAGSKFGLNVEQLLAVIDKLRALDMLDIVQLIHCHLGSQMTSIHSIRDSMLEVARFYVELKQLGVDITTVDVGGGLGVDYEGRHSNSACSINYTLEEYAMNILIPLQQLANEAGMPMPDVISESGRAITAHHAVVVTNLNGVEKITKSSSIPIVPANAPFVVKDIIDTYNTMYKNPGSALYNYALHALTAAQGMFKHGSLGLQDLATVEQIYKAICLSVRDQLDLDNPADYAIYETINEQFAEKLYMNLSIFQSIPDAWAVQQIFPIIPLSQLNQPRTVHGILQDLTCDSHGKVDQYTSSTEVRNTLLLPEFDPQNPYNIGFFLVGAYQEILGNLHNLFGDTNSLDVRIHGDGEFTIMDQVTGDTIANVLHLANYDPKKILQSCEQQLLHTDLSEEQIAAYLNELRSTFTQLTYLELKKPKQETQRSE